MDSPHLRSHHQPDPNDLLVMSYNLRYPAADKHPWAGRFPIATALLTAAAPHVVGTQEGEIDQLEELVAALPDRYVWLGEGFAGGNAGEFTAVIYDSTRLAVDTVAVQWLSAHPDTVNSVSWKASHARTLTVVDFTDILTGRKLRFLNTHLDHKSHEARLHSVELITEQADQAPDACILTGDFNVDEHNEIHAMFTTRPEFDDAFELVSPPVDVGTFHGYRGPKVGGKRIDWIMPNPAFEVIATNVNTFTSDGQYPSDHFPIEALLRYRPATA